MKAGDSIYRIAKNLQVAMNDLLTLNHLTATSVIHPGQRLAVPATSTAATPTTSPPTTSPATTTAAATTTATTRTTTAGSTAVTTPSPPTSSSVPNPPPPAPGSTTYTVVAGDYFASIARKSGVTLTALLAANDLVATTLLLPGRQLIVPPATLPIPATVTPTSTVAAPATPDAVTPPATTAPATTAPAVTTPVTTVPAATTPVTTPVTTPATATAVPLTGSIATLIAYLRAQVGKGYAFNTSGPDTFDCSGLVTAAYLQIGINLPHQSGLQSLKGTPVDWHTQPLLPGDLIFQYSSATPGVIGHVGVVIDSTHWIQASRPGTPVSIGPVPASTKIVAVRRIVTT